MGAFSNYLEAKTLNRVLNAQTDSDWAAITSVYLALFTTAPNYETGSGGTEVTGGSYARKQMTAAFTVSGGSASNTADAVFVTASADWGTIVAVGIYDASTSGNLLIGGDLTASRVVSNGGTAKFAATALAITLD